MAHCPRMGSKFRPAIAASRIARALLCLMISSFNVVRKIACNLAAALILLMALPALSMAQAADDKGSTPGESSRQNSGVGIDSVINQNNDDDAWKLLEQGFVIECSGRFESGCRLFLKTD